MKCLLATHSSTFGRDGSSFSSKFSGFSIYDPIYGDKAMTPTHGMLPPIAGMLRSLACEPLTNCCHPL
eukprot:1159168-Pelagomonas_calceolata.AAC.1